jgi:hypothetical protein
MVIIWRGSCFTVGLLISFCGKRKFIVDRDQETIAYGCKSNLVMRKFSIVIVSK